MKTANAIARLKALPKFEDDGRRISAQIGSYIVSCLRNGGPTAERVTCFHSRHINDISDSLSDYHSGSYHDNLSQAIRSAQSGADSEAKDMAAGRAAADQLGVLAPTTRMEAYQLVDQLHRAERQALSLQEA